MYQKKVRERKFLGVVGIVTLYVLDTYANIEEKLEEIDLC
jgi:hypothetical protein